MLNLHLPADGVREEDAVVLPVRHWKSKPLARWAGVPTCRLAWVESAPGWSPLLPPAERPRG